MFQSNSKSDRRVIFCTCYIRSAVNTNGCQRFKTKAYFLVSFTSEQETVSFVCITRAKTGNYFKLFHCLFCLLYGHEK